jgi:hypothetical protein
MSAWGADGRQLQTTCVSILSMTLPLISQLRTNYPTAQNIGGVPNADVQPLAPRHRFVDVLANGFVAFAGGIFEAIAIDDFDFAA